MLNEKGIPTEVVATHLTPPRAVMGPLAADAYQALISSSQMTAKYSEAVDPESAYEILTKRVNEKLAEEEQVKQQQAEAKEEAKQKNEKSAFEEVIDAPITRQIGKEIVRGIFGMLIGKKPRSRKGGIFGF